MCVGDLEGRLHTLLRLLYDERLVVFENATIKWIGDATTYVVQVGDEVDASRWKNIQHTDLMVPLFMDFLQRISDGKVIPIVGNHELLNVDASKNKYVHNNNALFFENSGIISEGKRKRTELFQRHNIMGKILRRRNFMCYFKPRAFFAHAGCRSVNVKGRDPSQVVQRINALDMFRPDAQKKDDELNDFLWHRDFQQDDYDDENYVYRYPHEETFVNDGLRANLPFFDADPDDRVDVHVIGHNKIYEEDDELYAFWFVPFDDKQAAQPQRWKYKEVGHSPIETTRDEGVVFISADNMHEYKVNSSNNEKMENFFVVDLIINGPTGTKTIDVLDVSLTDDDDVDTAAIDEMFRLVTDEFRSVFQNV
ncbi:MAG: metallophosphoesterase [Halobacteriaceae archaeon]